MATYTKFQSFVEALSEGTHDLGSHDLTVGLTTDVNAPVVGDTVRGDLTEVAYDYCSSRLLIVASSAQTGGVYKLVVNDLILTASGGDIGPFQWVFIYNDSAGSDELVCFFDYGSEITVLNGETFTLDFDPSDGLLQLA